jgi:OOP family OmpA-OmpF porin
MVHVIGRLSLDCAGEGKMTFFIKKPMVVMALVTGVLLTGMASAADLRTTLFTDTDALMEQALQADADILSPKNFAAAQSAYERAESHADRGRADKATKELQKVNGFLAESLEASKLANVTFRDTIKLRNLAITADAAQNEPLLWKEAESQFSVATKWLEAGNVKKAQKNGTRALNEYAIAELAAIKTGIVGEARILINEAEQDKVERFAPISLSNARALVAKAESDIDTNRYSTAGPGLLAAEAEYEARHAMFIKSQAEAIDGRSKTIEQLILEWEQPIQNTAKALEVTTDMSAGYSLAGKASQIRATQLVSHNNELTARVSELEISLGGTELLVEETQRLHQQLADIENLFEPSQARVIREGNDLILRLVGLSFPTGKSFIETKYFSLLTQVQDAVGIFPETAIVIEGHTDAQGADNTNINLSQERADSVREYLIANLGLPASRVSSIGYGKTSPIASNETDAGRVQNRRIDVVIVDARVRENTHANSRP